MEDNEIEYFKSLFKTNSKQIGNCIEWTGKLSGGGYGYIYAFKRIWSAHRVSYLIEHGELPYNLYICHICNNKKCIKPEHLYAGTAKQNSQDFIKSDGFKISREKSLETRQKNSEKRAVDLEESFARHKQKMINEYIKTIKKSFGIDIEKMIDDRIEKRIAEGSIFKQGKS